MTVVVIMGILAAFATWGLRAYQATQDELGTANTVLESLRNIAERAQSEASTYCVQFNSDNRSWTVWHYSCSSAASGVAVSSNNQVQGGGVSLSGVSFTLPAGTSCAAGMASTTCVYFYPRGNATPGQVQVMRTNSSKTYTIKVEGLTGRVYLG